MKTIFFIACGGAAGSLARYGISVVSIALLGTGFPWGTLFINVCGCLIIGWLFGTMLDIFTGHDPLRLFLATGFLGAFTTFSAFSLESLQLWQKGDVTLAIVYVMLSIILSLIAVWAGFIGARAFV